MPYGMGDLIGNLVNPGMQSQLATALSPNASPLPQQGQGAPPSGQPAPKPNLAPPAVTQPDPANSNLVGLLLRDAQTARAAEGFNRGTAEMASAFGTAQQQASKKAALGGGGGAASPLGDIGDIMKIQQAVTDQNEHARFQANMGVLAKVLFPGDPDGIAKATEVANNKGLLEQFGGTAAGNATVTGTSKDFQTARAAAAADLKATHPDWTPQQIQAEVMKQVPASMLGTSVGNQTPEEAQYNQYVAAERAAGRVPDQFNIWKGKQTSEVKSITDINQTNLDAKQSWPQVKAVWDEHLSTIDWLHDPAHRQAVVAAITRPELLTQGNWGNAFKALGVTSQEVETAKGYLDQYQNQLTSEKFTGSKNVRSNFEAKFLGGSASHLFQKTNDEATVSRELDRLYGETHTRAANAAAAAGQEIPYDQAGNVDKSLIDKTNPLYNGATVAPPPKSDGSGGGKPLPDATDAWVKDKLAASPGEKAAVIRHFEDMGFDMSKYK